MLSPTHPPRSQLLGQDVVSLKKGQTKLEDGQQGLQAQVHDLEQRIGNAVTLDYLKRSERVTVQ